MPLGFFSVVLGVAALAATDAVRCPGLADTFGRLVDAFDGAVAFDLARFFFTARPDLAAKLSPGFVTAFFRAEAFPDPADRGFLFTAFFAVDVGVFFFGIVP